MRANRSCKSRSDPSSDSRIRGRGAHEAKEDLEIGNDALCDGTRCSRERLPEPVLAVFFFRPALQSPATPAPLKTLDRCGCTNDRVPNNSFLPESRYCTQNPMPGGREACIIYVVYLESNALSLSVSNDDKNSTDAC